MYISFFILQFFFFYFLFYWFVETEFHGAQVLKLIVQLRLAYSSYVPKYIDNRHASPAVSPPLNTASYS